MLHLQSSSISLHNAPLSACRLICRFVCVSVSLCVYVPKLNKKTGSPRSQNQILKDGWGGGAKTCLCFVVNSIVFTLHFPHSSLNGCETGGSVCVGGGGEGLKFKISTGSGWKCIITQDQVMFFCHLFVSVCAYWESRNFVFQFYFAW